MNDHRVQNRPIFPASAYLLAALAAADESMGTVALEDVEFNEALFVEPDKSRTLQISIQKTTDPSIANRIGSFSVFSSPVRASNADGWRKHASGKLAADQSKPQSPNIDFASYANSQIRFVSAENHYSAMEAVQLNYGPAFRGVNQIQSVTGAALTRLTIPDGIVDEVHHYGIHPATLDACFQALLALTPHQGDETSPWMPVGCDKVRLWRTPGEEETLLALVAARPESSTDEKFFVGDIVLIGDAHQAIIEVRGLKLRRVERRQDDVNTWLHEVRWLSRPLPETRLDAGRWLVLLDQGGIGAQLAAKLSGDGNDATQVSPDSSGLDCDRILREFVANGNLPARGVIDMRAMDSTLRDDSTSEELLQASSSPVGGLLQLIQSLAKLDVAESPRLLVVTRGSQAVGPSAENLSLIQAAAWSTAGVAAVEHPNLKVRRIDLDSVVSIDDAESLFAEIRASEADDTIAYRKGDRLVPRLVPLDGAASGRLVFGNEDPSQLVISKPGSLDGLAVVPLELKPLGKKEVRIRVRASGVNFHDVLNTLGSVNAIPLGLECSGVIAETGEGVLNLKAGDEVFAVGLGSFGTHFTTHEALVAPKPSHLSHELSATLPIGYLTAHYALRHIARMKRGDKVLIHSAAGGVGIAAVQLALKAGATVFGTAGSHRKREFLRAMGVHHVLDSRTLDFAEQIQTITAGTGVNVVLNSFTDEFITKTFSILAHNGRFVEIGKRGIWTNEQVAAHRPDVTYEIVELAQTMMADPESLRSMIRQLGEEAARGELSPLPIRVFPLTETIDAFRYMQQARHIGKIVLTQPPFGFGHPVNDSASFASGTWLITGGLGGLGLGLARWLADRGARNLVLVGRNAPSAESRQVLEQMESGGTRILVAAGDVSREQDVAAILDRMKATLPPLRGIFHLAGVLDDGLIRDLNWDRFVTVYRPKVLGAWNLHRLTRDMPLDCFVTYSSWVSMVPFPGQSNYSSANAFLDALAWQRRATGLTSLSINWGGWREVGMAARPERLAHLSRKGVGAITTAQGVDMVGRLLSQSGVQVGVCPFDADRWQTSGVSPGPAKFVELLTGDGVKTDEASSSLPPLRSAMQNAEPGADRRAVLESRIQLHLSRVLRLPAARFDARKPFKSLGLDSLTAQEVRNGLETETGLQLPATLVWNYATIGKLATELASRMGIPLENGIGAEDQLAEQVRKADETDEESLEKLLSSIEALPEDEIQRLLDSEPPKGVAQ